MSSKEIERLAGQIRHHRELYYNQTPELSDADFDALEDQLRELAPEHPVFAEVGAKPSTATSSSAVPGAQHRDAEWLHATNDRFYSADLTITKQEEKDYAHSYGIIANQAPLDPRLKFLVPPTGQWGRDWPKQEHVIAMGSLNKVNVADELRSWADRCKALYDQGIAEDLALTEKLDGISLAVVYVDGKFDRAITRGNGQVGERISSNVMRMKGIPAEISELGEVSVRGEIVLRKSDANELVQLRQEVDKSYTSESLRNTAAGAARSKNPNLLSGCQSLSVLFYDLSSIQELKTEAEKFEAIQKLGFSTPNFFQGNIEQVLEHYDAYQSDLREKLDYEIDGLVVRANQIAAQTALGDLNNRPRAAVAFKFGNEMGTTKLIDIEWQTGDTGRITPVAEVEMIRLAGAKIRHASLHNLANIKRLNVAVGDEVLVSRRNDVIPYVEKVERKGPNTFEPPSSCAQCGEAVSIDGEYLYCRNSACPAIRQGRLKTWINVLDLQGWGEERIKLIFEHGLAREPADLYTLSVEKMQDLRKPPSIVDGKKKMAPKLGTKNARLMLEPLLEKKSLALTTFIAALGIESVSKETAKLLVDAGFKSINEIVSADHDTLAAIHRLGEIKAKRILDGLNGRLDEIKRLAEVGVIPQVPKDKNSDDAGALSGMSFCFSGSHSRPRKTLQALVEDNGGEIRSGVSKGLNYLVLADANSTSSKAVKARKLGTQVIDEIAFEQLLEPG